MAQAISVSLSDETVERLNDEMDGYGDNRSEWVEDAIVHKLAQEAQA